MMPGAHAIIGVLFFLSLFTIGVDSAFFLTHGGVVAPLADKFGWNHKKLTLGICIIGFLVGLLYCTQAGLYWLDIIDRAVSFYGLLITGLLACLVVGWVFGARKLREHINATSDFKVGAMVRLADQAHRPAGHSLCRHLGRLQVRPGLPLGFEQNTLRGLRQLVLLDLGYLNRHPDNQLHPGSYENQEIL